MDLELNEPEPREGSPPDMDDEAAEAEDISIKEANLSKKIEAILKTHCIAIRQVSGLAPILNFFINRGVTACWLCCLMAEMTVHIEPVLSQEGQLCFNL